MWFLARMYDAQQALQMGLINTVSDREAVDTYCVPAVDITSMVPATRKSDIAARVLC